MPKSEPTQEQLDAYYLKVMDQIKEMGWIVQAVFGAEDDTGYLQCFAYTVGLTAKDLPELYMNRMSPQQATPILNGVARAMLAGAVCRPGAEIDAEFNVNFRLHGPINSHTAECFVARSMYDPDELTVMQVLFPDTAGKYPDDVGYDTERFPQQLMPLRSL